MRRSFFRYVLVFGLTLIFSNVHAQCDPFFDPFCEDVDVPLDNGVVFVLTVAAAVGAWFIFKRNMPEVQKM